MANELTITLTVQDAKAKKSQVKTYMANGTTLAQATTAAQDLAQYIKALILGEIVSIQVSADIAVPVGAQGAADLTSDCEEKGRFMFRTAAGKSMRLSLPTYNESRTLPNTPSVDLTDADVQTFIEWFTAGLPKCDSNGIAIVTVDKAYEAYD